MKNKQLDATTLGQRSQVQQNKKKSLGYRLQKKVDKYKTHVRKGVGARRHPFPSRAPTTRGNKFQKDMEKKRDESDRSPAERSRTVRDTFVR
jgi:hypothetical protein